MKKNQFSKILAFVIILASIVPDFNIKFTNFETFKPNHFAGIIGNILIITAMILTIIGLNKQN